MTTKTKIIFGTLLLVLAGFGLITQTIKVTASAGFPFNVVSGGDVTVAKGPSYLHAPIIVTAVTNSATPATGVGVSINDSGFLPSSLPSGASLSGITTDPSSCIVYDVAGYTTCTLNFDLIIPGDVKVGTYPITVILKAVGSTYANDEAKVVVNLTITDQSVVYNSFPVKSWLYVPGRAAGDKYIGLSGLTITNGGTGASCSASGADDGRATCAHVATPSKPTLTPTVSASQSTQPAGVVAKIFPRTINFSSANGDEWGLPGLSLQISPATVVSGERAKITWTSSDGGTCTDLYSEGTLGITSDWTKTSFLAAGRNINSGSLADEQIFSGPGTYNLKLYCKIGTETFGPVTLPVTVTAPADAVVFNSPSGNESWEQGSTHQVSWTNTTTNGQDVKLTLYNMTTGTSVAETPNTSVTKPVGQTTWNWTIPSSLTSGKYKFRATIDLNTSLLTFPGNPFNIVASGGGGVTPPPPPPLPPSAECEVSTVLGDFWPGSNPPGGNASVPLNVGSKSQTKKGCLAVGGTGTQKPVYPLDVTGNGLISGVLMIGNRLGIGLDATPSVALDVNGSIKYTGSLVGPGSSDERLKKNIVPMSGTLAKILQLKPVTFQWKDPTRPVGTKLGLIAQDVEKIFPEVVTIGSDGFKSVDYAALVGPVIKMIQSKQIQINELRQEINALKARK